MLTNDNSKMISYFTPSYNTGVKIYDTYMSLKAQTYLDWEWVIVDDSNDNGKTLQIIKNIASIDPRVRVYSFEEKSGGVIGVKFEYSLNMFVYFAMLPTSSLIAPNRNAPY